jgi:tagaturonate reductase
MLACELIDNNGKELLKCVNQYIEQWGLEDGFKKYVNEDCTFCGSLVDRIVPGRIRDAKEVAELEEKHGYEDPLLDVGEVFGVWVIEGDEKLNDVLPFRKAGLEDKVFVTPDMSPYKKRKVRILNGAHTGFVLGAYLAGEDIVRDCMHDEVIKGFMNKMLYDEVIPTLTLDKNDLIQFAAAVQDRFNNPFVNHELMSISLNSTSKWKARNMPSFLGYIEAKGELPACLTMSLAAYIAFYSNDIQSLTDAGLVCKRPAGNEYTVSDDRWALEFYYEHKNDSAEELVHAVLSNTKMWDQDLTEIAGLEAKVVEDLKMIRTEGAKAAYASCL